MPRPRALHADLTSSWFERTFAQIATLATVGAIGAGALAATGAATTPGGLTAAAATSRGHRVVVTDDEGSRQVAAAAKRHSRHGSTHAPARPAARHAAAQPSSKAAAATHPSSSGGSTQAARWMPQGIGMWIYEWRRTSHGSAHDVVARARHTGLSTLYLRTGSSWDGLSGRGPLRRLLRASASTDIHVVAWDFPRLRHPQRDALRLARAAHITVGRDHRHVAAVAPDIETPAEGTFNASWRVRQYLRTLHRHLPAGVTVLTAVPWPSRYRIGDYPYGTVAAHSDVLIPMAYWYNNPPALVTARSIHYLRRFHRPIAPVGQGYDGRLDVPGLHHNNLSKQLPAFLHTAHHAGVRAVSVWSWQAAPKPVWKAIRRNHHLFSTRGPAGR